MPSRSRKCTRSIEWHAAQTSLYTWKPRWSCWLSYLPNGPSDASESGLGSLWNSSVTVGCGGSVMRPLMLLTNANSSAPTKPAPTSQEKKRTIVLVAPYSAASVESAGLPLFFASTASVIAFGNGRRRSVRELIGRMMRKERKSVVEGQRVEG